MEHHADESDIQCAFRCESVELTKCTGFLFDKKTNICSIGEAEFIPFPLQPENTGLKVAWTSVKSYSKNRIAWFCIDGNTRGSGALANVCFVFGGSLMLFSAIMSQ